MDPDYAMLIATAALLPLGALLAIVVASVLRDRDTTRGLVEQYRRDSYRYRLGDQRTEYQRFFLDADPNQDIASETRARKVRGAA